MPCKPQKAKRLLREGKARVVTAQPYFIIKLLHGASGYRQPVTAGMDTGSKTIGAAAISSGRVLYQSEVQLRQDITKKMRQRAAYRRTRRNRKTRYRPARWLNRESMRREGRLAPSVQSKLDSHLREKRFVESILPVTSWRVETAQFDIHKIAHPDVEGVGYQEGPQKGWYNVKAYVLARDGYKCQRKEKGVKHSKTLHVHHIVHRKDGGSNSTTNLIALCKDCHAAHHRGEFEIKVKTSQTKHPTEAGIIQARLKSSGWEFAEVFGYETKFQREQLLGLDKSHWADAVAIACAPEKTVELSAVVYYKRHVARGDYQQTKGKHSEKRIPTGKLFGFRKHDYVDTPAGRGFVKGKRSSGRFSIADLFGNVIHASVDMRRARRLSARTSTMAQRGGAHSSPGINSGVSCAQDR